MRLSPPVLAILGMVLAAPLLAVAAWPGVLPALLDAESYLIFHMAAETAAAVVAMMIFGLGWHRLDSVASLQTTVLAAAFLAVALIDFAHLLSYPGMPRFVTGNGTEKAIHFWLSARPMDAAALLGLAILRWRADLRNARAVAMAAALAYVGLTYVAVLGFPEWLLRVFIPGSGLTTVKIATEYLIVAMHLATVLVLLLRPSKLFPAPYLIAAALVLALSEMSFTLYAGATDLANLLGHLYKVLGYALLYRGLYVTGIQAPYLQLSESNDRFRALAMASPVGVFRAAADGRLTFCNEHLIDLTGLPEERLVAEGWLD